jgi:nitrogen fixation protein FixH
MNAPAESTPRRRRFPVWGWIVVAMLLVHASAMVFAAVIATRDPNFAVLPDYYRRAVAWDETKEKLQHSADLGWSLNIQATDPDAAGTRTLRIDVHDRNGKPIEAQSISLNLYHDAHIRQAQALNLPSRAPGVFSAALPMPWSGHWTMEAVVIADGETFVSQQKVFLLK